MTDHLISGTFDNPEAANRALNALIDMGYVQSDINVIMSEATRRQYFPEHPHEPVVGDDSGSVVAQGAAGGGMIGGTLGAIVGALTLPAAIGATVMTGGLAAPFIAGPLALVLAAGGAGAAAGSVLGAVGALGVTPETPTLPHIEDGSIIISVEASSLQSQKVLAILTQNSELIPESVTTSVPTDTHLSPIHIEQSDSSAPIVHEPLFDATTPSEGSTEIHRTPVSFSDSPVIVTSSKI